MKKKKKRIWGCSFPEKIAVSRTVDMLSKFCVSQTSLGQDLSDESYAPQARLFPGYCIHILSLSLVYTFYCRLYKIEGENILPDLGV